MGLRITWLDYGGSGSSATLRGMWAASFPDDTSGRSPGRVISSQNIPIGIVEMRNDAISAINVNRY